LLEIFSSSPFFFVLLKMHPRCLTKTTPGSLHRSSVRGWITCRYWVLGLILLPLNSWRAVGAFFRPWKCQKGKHMDASAIWTIVSNVLPQQLSVYPVGLYCLYPLIKKHCSFEDELPSVGTTFSHLAMYVPSFFPASSFPASSFSLSPILHLLFLHLPFLHFPFL
jgi:hypothetical protein